MDASNVFYHLEWDAPEEIPDNMVLLYIYISKHYMHSHTVLLYSNLYNIV